MQVLFEMLNLVEGTAEVAEAAPGSKGNLTYEELTN